MNVKYTLKNVDNGWVFSGVFNEEENLELQLMKHFCITPGHGIGVNIDGDRIELSDYYHASSMAEFAVLSREETGEPVSSKWQKIK